MSNIQNMINKLIDAVKNTGDKTSAYDTSAEVKRIEGDTAWVHIPGGVDETPVKLTINASEGDNVQVRVNGGRAWLQGNATAPPTDDTTANVARTIATDAQEEAVRAGKAADAAEAEAVRAGAAADRAEESASDALTAAQSAQTSADSALVSLSTVEDVAGVLEWITSHGTMTLTSDVTVNPSHVYFVVDAGGDYVVGSTHYSIVSEPKDSELSTYYELSVDKSIQNYVATHIVIDSEGLWLIPDSGGNKVLIATGAGSSYTTAGTYIIGKVNGVDTVFAKFTQDNVTMGEESKPHLEVYKNGLQLIDTYGEEYFDIHDYRTGTHDVDQTFKGDGSATVFSLIVEAINTTDMTVYVNGSAVTSGITKTVYAVTFNSAPADGAIVRVKYTSRFASRAKAYTIGKRSNNSNKGEYSVALGYDLTANGDCSVAENAFSTASGHYAHAEGYTTYANGNYSHSEGWNSSANGSMSHAQNYNTRADGDYQTAIGKFNSIDNTSALIIGNGTADNARSNALTVDWNGNVNIPSGAQYKINGTPIGSGAVSGVKGNAESTYRTGNVNITPANVGAVPTTRTVNSKALSSDISLTASDVGAVPTSRTVNSKALSSNITLAPSDLGINDYVIAQSQSSTSYGNGVWRWREWKSGKVEIWYHGYLTLTSADSDRYGVKRYSRWFNFPNSYSLYRCSAIVNGMNDGGWYGCGGIQNASSQVAEPYRKFQVMSYRISSAPPAQADNLNIYICGQKSI